MAQWQVRVSLATLPQEATTSGVEDTVQKMTCNPLNEKGGLSDTDADFEWDRDPENWTVELPSLDGVR